MQLFFALQQATTVAKDVGGAVDQLTDFLLRYLIPLAAVGAFAMAFIEFGKKLLDSRTKFQTLRWIEWMRRSGVDEESALAELLQLCTGISPTEAQNEARALFASHGHLPLLYAWSRSPAHAVFALDLGRMMGSIQEAADIALATPVQYESLYRFMTSGADPNDVAQWQTRGSAAMLDVDGLPEAEQKKIVKEQAERFARLRHIIKRKLDGFQLYTGDRWATWNQFAANIAGAVVMFGVLLWLNWAGRNLPFSLDALVGSFTLGIVPLSLMGGILSPLAKDLVTALKRVKDG